MDEIQKTLIKVGRKDLAQEYYLKISQISFNITNKGSFQKYLENLGLTVDNIRPSKLDPDGIVGDLQKPFDLSTFSYLGTPRKQRSKGKIYFIYSIKGKGELTVSDGGMVRFIRGESIKCDVPELIAFVKDFGVKATKGDIRYGTTTVDLKNDNARQLLIKLRTKYKVELKDGYGTPGKDNYAWSDYRWEHPEYGTMGLFIDRRPSKISAIKVFGK